MESSGRDMCWNCRRSKSTCFCLQVKPFLTGPLFVLLVHPREGRNRIGTVRIIKRCIPESILIEGTGEDLDLDPRLECLLNDSRFEPRIIYPGPDSQPVASLGHLEEGQAALNPLHLKRLLLFLVDGTWAHAKSMLRTSRRLQSLRQLSFNPMQTSNYRIRKQPSAQCVSSVEAVYTMLEKLDEAGIYPLPENSFQPTANLEQNSLRPYG